MIFRCFLFIFFIISCNKPIKDEDEVEIEELTKEQSHKKYVQSLHRSNLEEVYRNQDFINILSIKYDIADSICTTIIVDYLDVFNNKMRDYTNQYKIETIKNYAFENNLQEEQVASLLHDYISYRDSKNKQN